ncbi:MAG: shikimate dehydrogenase [Bacteroidia bacterium]
MIKNYGLIGESLSHSFSKKYFEEKFSNLNLDNYIYTNFELKEIKNVAEILNIENLFGLNITNPYKTSIINYVDSLSIEAKDINAVNCIKKVNNKWVGFNTDYYGFSQSIKPFLEPKHNKALIIGTGGASKAVAYALSKIGIDVFYLSRNVNAQQNVLGYNQLNKHVIEACKLIVNCTPIGLYPNINDCPNLPYEFIAEDHLCYDLIYNPKESLFLSKCKTQGALIVNGYSMLQLQAEKAWEIWNDFNVNF